MMRSYLMPVSKHLWILGAAVVACGGLCAGGFGLVGGYVLYITAISRDASERALAETTPAVPAEVAPAMSEEDHSIKEPSRATEDDPTVQALPWTEMELSSMYTEQALLLEGSVIISLTENGCSFCLLYNTYESHQRITADCSQPPEVYGNGVLLTMEGREEEAISDLLHETQFFERPWKEMLYVERLPDLPADQQAALIQSWERGVLLI